jgi:hypothetical protein
VGAAKVFQICYEGELTSEIALALRRLRGEPTFDKSWMVQAEEDRHSVVLLRYLRKHLAADGHLLVAQTHMSRARDFLLIRHSGTESIDYEPLYRAIARLGYVVELPFRSTFIVAASDHRDTKAIGEQLSTSCPDDSLMVVGIGHDVAVCNGGASRMFVPHEATARGFALRNC